ncbi:MAG: hypothetical protein OEY23_13720 [Acidimicrobiia bacterium]|nr:hypothetical protein [Acidimicrobiia bacterium]
MLDKELAKARQKLEAEYRQVHESLGEIHVAFDAVLRAGPEDDLSGLLEALEDKVHAARTGGVLGSGANGHKRALAALRELQGR